MLAITDLDGGNVIEVRPRSRPARSGVEHAEDYDAGSVIVTEESLTEPPAWSELDLATGERTLLKRREVPGYDPARYRPSGSAPGPATAAIPVTLAYARGTPLDGTAPCLLYGYGAYEACSDPEFSVGPALAARPRRGLRDRAHPRRRRGRPDAGGSRAGCGPSRPRSPTSSTSPTGWPARTAGGAGRRQPDRVPGPVGRRPAAGRGVLACARTGGAPWSPRCRSWTA